MKLIQTTTAALALAVLAPLASARHVNMVGQQEFQAMASTRVQMVRPQNGGSSHRPFVRSFRGAEARFGGSHDRADQRPDRGHGAEDRKARQAEKLAELLKIHQNLGGGNAGGGDDYCPPSHPGNGGGPTAAPTPSAALAGLGGLGALLLKRRRKG